MKRRISKKVALATLLAVVLLMGAATGCTQGVKGTPVELKLFSMTCPDGWTLNEENKADEERDCRIAMDVMEGENSLINLTVHVYGSKFKSYRGLLKQNGIDAYKMVEEDAYTTKKIGDIDMVEVSDKESLLYIGRAESAEMSIEIKATGDVADPRVEEAISTISFTIPDDGNVDPPWPWNGERFTTDKEHTAMVADKKIKSEYIPFAEPVIADDIFSGKAELAGGSLWVLLDSKLSEYSKGKEFTFAKEVKLPNNNYEDLSSDTKGNIYATGFGRPMQTIKNGEIVASNEDVDRAVIDNSGKFGISFFYNCVPKKVTIQDNIASVSEWSFIDKEKVRNAGLTKNSMYVTGLDPKTKNNALWIYDKDGNLKKTLGNVKFPDQGSIGSITDVIETDSGYMALDGNSRKIILWKKNGTLIGEIDDEDLFGTHYCWLSSISIGDDGNIYVGLTEGRADESADEFLVYKLSGF